MLKIKNPIKSKNDLLFDSPVLLKETKLGKEKFDFLIINGKPHSFQFNYVAKDFENLIDYLLSKQKKIITTEKIADVPCTRDYGFNIIDIARVSLNTKNILGVLIGPMHISFTKFSKAKRWYVLSSDTTSLNWWAAEPDKILHFDSVKKITKKILTNISYV